MRHSNKASAQKYLRRAEQFQSPQFSTVIEVNPSCESQQSMLEKIIFPGRSQVANINNCDPKLYRNAYLTERNSNHCERRKNYVLNQKEQNNYGTEVYGRHSRSPSIKAQIQSKQSHYRSKPQYNNFKKIQFYQSSQQAYSSTSQIDEDKLQRIQQKIKSYQMKQNNKENKENQTPQYRNRSNYDTMEKELSKIQIYPPEVKMKKQQTIIDKIKDQRFMTERRPQNLSKTKEFSFEPSIDRFTKNSQKCLQTIYELVLIDRTLKLSPTNINLKNSIKQEIKLVLGSIFADVTIKGRSISKQQFVEKANQILSSYRDEEIEDIFFSIVNGLSKSSKDQQKFLLRKDDPRYIELTRIPGKVLKNSKTGCETKQKQQSQSRERNQDRYFSHFNQMLSNNLTGRSSIERYQPAAQKVSKTAYIEQTQKFEHGESLRQKTPMKKSTKLNLKNQSLEMMFNEERSKRQQSAFEKVDNKGSKLSKNDEELERLNNLEKKFNDHFRSQGKS